MGKRKKKREHIPPHITLGKFDPALCDIKITGTSDHTPSEKTTLLELMRAICEQINMQGTIQLQSIRGKQTNSSAKKGVWSAGTNAGGVTIAFKPGDNDTCRHYHMSTQKDNRDQISAALRDVCGGSGYTGETVIKSEPRNDSVATSVGSSTVTIGDLFADMPSTDQPDTTPTLSLEDWGKLELWQQKFLLSVYKAFGTDAVVETSDLTPHVVKARQLTDGRGVYMMLGPLVVAGILENASADNTNIYSLAAKPPEGAAVPKETPTQLPRWMRRFVEEFCRRFGYAATISKNDTMACAVACDTPERGPKPVEKVRVLRSIGIISSIDPEGTMYRLAEAADQFIPDGAVEKVNEKPSLAGFSKDPDRVRDLLIAMAEWFRTNPGARLYSNQIRPMVRTIQGGSAIADGAIENVLRGISNAQYINQTQERYGDSYSFGPNAISLLPTSYHNDNSLGRGVSEAEKARIEAKYLSGASTVPQSDTGTAANKAAEPAPEVPTASFSGLLADAAAMQKDMLDAAGKVSGVPMDPNNIPTDPVSAMALIQTNLQAMASQVENLQRAFSVAQAQSLEIPAKRARLTAARDELAAAERQLAKYESLLVERDAMQTKLLAAGVA